MWKIYYWVSVISYMSYLGNAVLFIGTKVSITEMITTTSVVWKTILNRQSILSHKHAVLVTLQTL